jgi:cell division protein FtsL
MTAAARRSAWMEAWEADLMPSAASERSVARLSARTAATRYYGREATARLPQPSPELERREPLPKPRLVARRHPRWAMIAVTMMFGAALLTVGIVSPMLLAGQVTDVETQVGRMESRQAQLTTTIAVLSSQISALSAPDRVAEQAAQLGLRPAEKIHYVENGGVQGGGMEGTEGDTTVAGR